MARLQYQPATKPRGFQPVQLSRAGIARMEEEGNRVIRNLEDQRNAANQQRQENLQAMQQNAVYEQRQQERIGETLKKNAETERLNRENERKFKARQAASEEGKLESALTSLVNFSATAGKIAAERTQQMIIDQTEGGAQEARQKFLTDLEAQNNFATVESQIDVSIEQYDNDVVIAGAKGLDSSLGVSKSLAANPGRGYYWKKGYYNEIIKQQTPLLTDRVLQSTEELFTDKNGKKFSGIEAVNDPDKMGIVLAQVQKRLYGAAGLNVNSLEPGFLADSTEFVNKYSTTRMQQASSNATNINYSNLEQEALSHMEQGRIGMGFRSLLKNPKVGREGALKAVFNLFTQQNADGSFRYSLEELNNTKLLGDKTLLEERGNSQRYQDAIAARRKARTDFLRGDQTRVRIEAQDFANSALPQMQEYFENADAQGDLTGAATFEKEFYERYPNQSLPSGYVRAKKAALKENYDAEVASIQAKARTQTLDSAFIDSIENPKLQLEAIKAFKQQEEAKYGPKYSLMRKSLVSEAKTLTKFDPTVEGPGSGTTIIVTNALKNEYKYFFKALVDKGVPLDAAADQAYAQLTDYIAKGATDKTNKFYTETGALNKPTFPNIQGATQSLSASSQEQRNELNKLILQNNANVGSVFSAPNAVLSETQIETTVNSYYADNGTFKIPVNIQYAAKLAGVNPIAAINAQIQASNEKYGANRKLITASPAEEAIFDQVPTVQK